MGWLLVLVGGTACGLLATYGPGPYVTVGAIRVVVLIVVALFGVAGVGLAMTSWRRR